MYPKESFLPHLPPHLLLARLVPVRTDWKEHERTTVQCKSTSTQGTFQFPGHLIPAFGLPELSVFPPNCFPDWGVSDWPACDWMANNPSSVGIGHDTHSPEVQWHPSVGSGSVGQAGGWWGSWGSSTTHPSRPQQVLSLAHLRSCRAPSYYRQSEPWQHMALQASTVEAVALQRRCSTPHGPHPETLPSSGQLSGWTGGRGRGGREMDVAKQLKAKGRAASAISSASVTAILTES